MKSQIVHLALVALPFLAACGDAPDTESNPESNPENEGAVRQPLTRIEVAPGHSVAVFEDEETPGAFTFHEVGGPDDESVFKDLKSSLPLSTLYRELLPGQEVPAEVAEATLRQAARSKLPATLLQGEGLTAISQRSEPADFTSAGLIQKEAPRNVADWRNNVCRPVGESRYGVRVVDAASCLTEKTGNAWGQIDWVFAGQSETRSYRGTITVSATHSFGGTWYSDGSVTLTEGRWTRWWRYDRRNQFYLRTEITNASGDGWHFATFGGLGGSIPVSETLIDCYDGGYHCAIGVIVQP